MRYGVIAAMVLALMTVSAPIASADHCLTYGSYYTCTEYQPSTGQRITIDGSRTGYGDDFTVRTSDGLRTSGTLYPWEDSWTNRSSGTGITVRRCTYWDC